MDPAKKRRLQRAVKGQCQKCNRKCNQASGYFCTEHLSKARLASRLAKRQSGGWKPKVPGGPGRPLKRV